MIWSKEETLPRGEIEAIQLAKLKETVQYIYARVAPYREKMDQANVKPEDIRTLDDLRRLPFTYKADFRDHYPMGLFAVDRKELVRFHASSGTTGKPTVVGYTRNDLEMWLNNVARIACMGGATADDVAQISFGYGTFTGALGLHGGLEKVGASVIPMSSGNTKKQIMFLEDMGVTLLVATPSYALHLGEEIRARGLDPEKDLKVRIGLFGGEGMTEPMRDEMHRVWGEGFLCTQNYGMSELCGPGVAGASASSSWACTSTRTGSYRRSLTRRRRKCCRRRAGRACRHLPWQGGAAPCPVPDRRYDEAHVRALQMRQDHGEDGEHLRARRRHARDPRRQRLPDADRGSAAPDPGDRTSTTRLLVERKNRLDVMTISVELVDDRLLDSYSMLSELEAKIKKGLKAQLGLATQIKLVAPYSLKRFEGKAKRVTDLRKDGL